MTDYTKVKCKHLYLGGCDYEEKVNKLLSSQEDGVFIIRDIQMMTDRSTSFAWIFYEGDFPDIKD